MEKLLYLARRTDEFQVTSVFPLQLAVTSFRHQQLAPCAKRTGLDLPTCELMYVIRNGVRVTKSNGDYNFKIEACCLDDL